MEKTLVIVKPDGVERGLVGQVIKRIEDKGFRLVAIKILRIDKGLARQHYHEHIDKPFFPEMLTYITSSPVVVMVWEGPGVISSVRAVMGSTDPLTAAPGTIRGDYGVSISRNIVHGSDSLAAAQREIALFFDPEELIKYQRSVDDWIISK